MRYLYRCPECQSEKEVEHLMSEDPEIECGGLLQEAQKDAPGVGTVYCEALMRRVITPDCANFILQGSGYYSTDRRVIKTPSDVIGKNIVTDARGKAV